MLAKLEKNEEHDAWVRRSKMKKGDTWECEFCDKVYITDTLFDLQSRFTYHTTASLTYADAILFELSGEAAIEP